MTTTLIQKVKSNPLGYARKAVSPFWWAQWYKNRKRLARRKADIEEAQRVLQMLHDMPAEGSQDIANYRQRKLSQLLQYAGKHCQYYKNVFRQVGFDPRSPDGFDQLPVLDKATIREHRDDLVSDEIANMDFYTMNTGGSTGEPLEFIASRVAGLMDKVHQEFVFKTTMGYQVGDVIVAFDGSIVPADFLERNVFWVAKGSGEDIPYGRLGYSSLYLNEKTIPYYIDHFINLSPSIIRGYPSAVNEVAEYILRNDILIPFRIKGVQLTAEVAHDWQIENIERAFRTKVFLQYGHSEVCVYGYTLDDSYEYLCSPFYGYVEVVNKDGLHVAPGEVGEVIVTGFWNTAMPFIRYRTGDLALFSSYTGGIVKLERILGGTQDYVMVKDGNRISLTALIFGQHYRAFRNIERWQLRQDVPGKVKVVIVKGQSFTLLDEEEIRDKFRSICDLDAEFEYVDSIPLSPRGKYQFLIQKLEV